MCTLTVKIHMKCHRISAFHQGLHCLLTQKQSSENFKEMQFYLEIIASDPLMYTMDQFETTKKNLFVHKGLKMSMAIKLSLLPGPVHNCGDLR